MRLGPGENQYCWRPTDIQGGGRPVVCGFGRDGSAMKAIVRRLHRLEDQFGSPGETEYDLWLRQRLEAAKRRIAEARKRGPAEVRFKELKQA